MCQREIPEQQGKQTHLWVHAAHSAGITETSLSPCVIYATFLRVGEDFVSVRGVRTIFRPKAKGLGVRMGNFFEELRVSSLVWMQPQSPAVTCMRTENDGKRSGQSDYFLR